VQARRAFLAHPLFLVVVSWVCFLNLFLAFKPFGAVLGANMDYRVKRENDLNIKYIDASFKILFPMISPKTVSWGRIQAAHSQQHHL